jgi:hypothetical protein
MRVHLLACAAVLASSCASAPAARAPKPGDLAVVVMPRQILAGQAAHVTWRIEPDDANREWCLSIEDAEAGGGQDYTRSCRSEFRRIQQRLFQGVPGGRYHVVLRVRRADGAVRRAYTTLCVADAETLCTMGTSYENPFDASRGGQP